MSLQHTECEQLKRLKEENARLREALEFVETNAMKKSLYYDRLVWFARCRDPGVKAEFLEDRRRELGEQKFQQLMKDIQDLRSDSGDFYHGFNLGCLATSRLFTQLAGITEPRVWENEYEFKFEDDDEFEEEEDDDDDNNDDDEEDMQRRRIKASWGDQSNSPPSEENANGTSRTTRYVESVERTTRTNALSEFPDLDT